MVGPEGDLDGGPLTVIWIIEIFWTIEIFRRIEIIRRIEIKHLFYCDLARN